MKKIILSLCVLHASSVWGMETTTTSKSDDLFDGEREQEEEAAVVVFGEQTEEEEAASDKEEGSEDEGENDPEEVIGKVPPMSTPVPQGLSCSSRRSVTKRAVWGKRLKSGRGGSSQSHIGSNQGTGHSLRQSHIEKVINEWFYERLKALNPKKSKKNKSLPKKDIGSFKNNLDMCELKRREAELEIEEIRKKQEEKSAELQKKKSELQETPLSGNHSAQTEGRRLPQDEGKFFTALIERITNPLPVHAEDEKEQSGEVNEGRQYGGLGAGVFARPEEGRAQVELTSFAWGDECEEALQALENKNKEYKKVDEQLKKYEEEYRKLEEQLQRYKKAKGAFEDPLFKQWLNLKEEEKKQWKGFFEYREKEIENLEGKIENFGNMLELESLRQGDKPHSIWEYPTQLLFKPIRAKKIRDLNIAKQNLKKRLGKLNQYEECWETCKQLDKTFKDGIMAHWNEKHAQARYDAVNKGIGKWTILGIGTAVVGGIIAAGKFAYDFVFPNKEKDKEEIISEVMNGLKKKPRKI